MAKIKLRINDQDVSIDTNDFPEIASEVRSELETEYAESTQRELTKQKSKFYKEVVNPLKAENAQLKASQASNPASPSAEPQNTSNQGSTANNAAPNPTPSPSAPSVDDVDEKIAKAVSSAMSPLTAYLEQQKARELQQAREKAISKYGEEIILDMVSGNTEEELANSALAAHEAYKKIAGKFTTPNPANPNPANPGNGTPNPNPTPASGQPAANQPPTNPLVQSPNTVTPLPVDPNSGNPPTMEQFMQVNGGNPTSDPRVVNPADTTNPNPAPVDVRSMTDEEYRKHRERLLKSTAPELASR